MHITNKLRGLEMLILIFNSTWVITKKVLTLKLLNDDLNLIESEG